MNNTTLFGSCRINGIESNNNINTKVSFTHSTKEVIQMIKFLRGDIKIPYPYSRFCFRTGIMNCHSISNVNFIQTFLESDSFIVEICSRKLYIHEGYYIHQLAVDNNYIFKASLPNNILQTLQYIKQTDDEIRNDMFEIINLLPKGRVVFATHYNSKLNGDYIPSRNNLINLVETVCDNAGVPCVNPTKVLGKYEQSDVMAGDLGHYNQLGTIRMRRHLNSVILNL